MKSVYHGSESGSLLRPKSWYMLPNDYKDIDSINTSKNKIKNWMPENSPWRLCKVYISNIGFVWERQRNLEYTVALGEVFLLRVNIVLLQVHATF